MDVSFGLGLLYINDWLLMFTVLLFSFYYYSTLNYGYWESRGIPGPKPNFPMGTLTGAMREMDVKNARKYGPVYGMYEGRRPILMVHDQEILKSVFVKNHQDFQNRRVQKGGKLSNMMLSAAEGEQWKVLRTVMSPTFSTGKLKLMFQQISECAEDLVTAIEKEANTGKSFEMKEHAGRFTIDVIATTAYGLKIDPHQNHNSQFIAMAKKMFEAIEFNVGYIFMLFFPFISPLFEALEVNFFPKDSIDFFKNVTQQTIEARKESGQKRTDFIQLMIDAHKETDVEKLEDEEHDKEFQEMYKGTTKRSLTMDEVISQGVLFLPAGYDTTATTITFLLYNLALHPEIQEKLHEEIVNVTGNEGITYKSVSEMDLLDMCTQESLRMYPPAYRTDRICSRDSKICRMDIPKGMIVTAPIYAIHHDPKIWPEPEKFNPYRFIPEEKAKHGSYDWMPFGAGPRNCLAMRLALMEVKVAVAHLVRKYKFVRSVDTEVPVEVKNVLCTPVNGINLELETR